RGPTGACPPSPSRRRNSPRRIKTRCRPSSAATSWGIACLSTTDPPAPSPWPSDTSLGTGSASAREGADDQRGVLPAEAKAVAQGVPHADLPGLVGDVVEVALRVGRLVVDR